jgi:predicted  nucleic acid-binding Zn-ribbon protein
LLAVLKNIEEDVHERNGPLVDALMKFEEDSNKCEDLLRDVKEQVKKIMLKVCNLEPSQLKIDRIDINFKKLLESEEAVKRLEKESEKLQITLDDLNRQYYKFENDLKDKL